MAVKRGSKRVNADGTPWARSGPKPVGMAEAPDLPATVDNREVAARPFVEVLDTRQPGEWLSETQKRAVIELLAIYDGDTRVVARLARMDRRVIGRLKHGNVEEYGARRAEWKRSMAVEMADIVGLAADRVRDTIGEASARDAMVIAGIAVDKSAMLAGESVAPAGRNVQVNIIGDSAIDQLRGRASDLLGRILDGSAPEHQVFDAEPAEPTDSRD